MDVNGEAADDLYRRRRDSDLEDASSDRTDIAAETGMDKVLVNHNNGAVAVTRPNEVTEHMVRIGCERFEMWILGVCSLKCQNETAEITLLNTVDQTRRVKTIPRDTTRYSRTNRLVYSFPTRGEQTTNATATDKLHGRLHNAQSTLRSNHRYPSG